MSRAYLRGELCLEFESQRSCVPTYKLTTRVFHLIRPAMNEFIAAHELDYELAPGPGLAARRTSVVWRLLEACSPWDWAQSTLLLPRQATPFPLQIILLHRVVSHPVHRQHWLGECIVNNSLTLATVLDCSQLKVWCNEEFRQQPACLVLDE